jgi:chromosomal replication initiation ATPase DnaA
MNQDAQLILAFEVPRSSGRDAYLVSPANREALRWVERWPDWPASGLILTGPEAAGKTHLAELWRERSGAGRIAGVALASREVPELIASSMAWVVDEADGAEHHALLHLYNSIVERRGSLLLTARTGSRHWGIELADLGSRLASLPESAIGMPDDALLHSLLIKHFADRQLIIGADVATYLAARMERSFAAAERLAAALDAASFARRQPITIPLARDVLASL